MLKIYDPATDQLRPVTRDDITFLQDLQRAYGRIRDAKIRATSLGGLVDEMDRIHADLQRRFET